MTIDDDGIVALDSDALIRRRAVVSRKLRNPTNACIDINLDKTKIKTKFMKTVIVALIRFHSFVAQPQNVPESQVMKRKQNILVLD